MGFIIEILCKNEMALEHVSDSLRNDKDVTLAAVKQNSKAIDFISDDLRYEYMAKSFIHFVQMD